MYDGKVRKIGKMSVPLLVRSRRAWRCLVSADGAKLYHAKCTIEKTEDQRSVLRPAAARSTMAHRAAAAKQSRRETVNLHLTEKFIVVAVIASVL